MQEMMEPFFTVLFQANPQSIGGGSCLIRHFTGSADRKQVHGTRPEANQILAMAADPCFLAVGLAAGLHPDRQRPALASPLQVGVRLIVLSAKAIFG